MHTFTITKINNQKLNTPRQLQKRIATINDVDFLINIHKELQANTIHYETCEALFVADSAQLITEIITSHKGLIMLYYDNDDFVGFWELNIPDNKDCLKEYQVPDDIDINTVGIYESIAVMPAYRGNKLQYEWECDFEEAAKSQGITTIVGTVHPLNTYSLNNVLNLNYKIIDEVDFHYGRRYIIKKHL